MSKEPPTAYWFKFADNGCPPAILILGALLVFLALIGLLLAFVVGFLLDAVVWVWS